MEKIIKKYGIIVVIVIIILYFLRNMLIQKYAVTEVEVVSPFVNDIIVKIKTPGYITSKKIYTITAPISGEIANMSESLIAGKKVKKGDVLCTIIPREEELSSLKEELKFAEYSLESAKREYEVGKQLFELKAISEQELKSKEINLLREESNVQKIKDKMQPKIIEVPFDGVIVKIDGKNGQVVNSGKEMFVVADMNILVAVIDVLETDISKVELGQEVIIYGEGLPQLIGKIENISMVKEETTPGELPKYKVQVGIQQKNLQLRLGSSIVGEILVERKNSVLQIPLECVLYELGEPVKPYVYVLVGDKVVKKYIEVGVNDGKYIEVVSGLNTTDRVVSVGNIVVKNGQRVKVRNKE